MLQLREGKQTKRILKVAEERLREFHAWLRELRFLDPACGSGNFLYVTMHTVKRIEVEVLNEIADLTGNRELRFQEVDPSQFYGIERSRWAREIAELTLWIGFHQFWRRAPRRRAAGPADPAGHGDARPPGRDPRQRRRGASTGTGPARSDAPPASHPVTGELVPDPGGEAGVSRRDQAA